MLAVPLIFVFRRLARLLLVRMGVWAIPVLVIGEGKRLGEALDLLGEEGGRAYRIQQVLSRKELTKAWKGSWRELVKRHGADTVVLALDEGEGEEGLVALIALEAVPFIALRSLDGLPVIRVEVQHAVGHDILMLSGQSALSRPVGQLVKTVMDYGCGLVFLVLTLPVALCVGVLIALRGGHVLYSQPRVGRNGKVFPCFKFRTMVPNADRMLAELLASDPVAAQEWAQTWKLRQDPRVTPIGRFLRASSLDELPQLLNVLRGEMSLIGPRPVCAEELDLFGRDLPFYLATKPGLSGLWQVQGRSGLDYDRRVQLNVWYVKNWSPWIDLVILFRTVKTVFTRHGAW